MPADLSEDKRIERETALRERFRKFWMGSVADAFKDDLEQLRKVRDTSSSTLISRLANALFWMLGT